MKYIIIPARGGSKGIKNKNLKKVGGVSLVEWSILHAKFISNKSDKIIVSSDSDQILNKAKKYKVVGLKRPKYLSGDKVFTEPVMDHVLSKFELKDKDLVILLQPTSPLRKKETLKKVVEAVESGSAESSLTLKSAHYFYWKKNGKFIKPEYSERPRRQDMTPQLVETGSVYVTTYKNYKKTGIRLSGKTQGIISYDSESVDVDNIIDLEFVNHLSDEYLREWKKEIKSKK